MSSRDHVDDLARVLIDAWEAVEGPVTPSYVASFADMARAAIAAGWTPPDGSQDAGWEVLVEGHADLLVERMRVVELVEQATQRAYGQIALDEVLTVQQITLPDGAFGAVVPGHWRDRAEAVAIVRVPDLRAVLSKEDS